MDDIESLIVAAKQREEVSDYEGAIGLYSKILDIDPNNLDIILFRAELYEEIEKHDKALEDYSAAILVNPNDEYIYQEKGILGLKAKRYEGAKEDFDNAIHLNSRLYDSYFGRAVATMHIGKLQEAYDEFSWLIEHKKIVHAAYLGRAYVNKLLKETTALEEDLSRYLYLKIGDLEVDIPNSFEAVQFNEMFNTAESLVYNNTPDEFKLRISNFFQGVLEKKLLLDGESNVAGGFYERGIELLTHLLYINKYHFLGYLWKARANRLLGKPNEAEFDFSKSIELKPDLALLYFERCMVRLAQSDELGAIQDCKCLLENLSGKTSKSVSLIEQLNSVLVEYEDRCDDSMQIYWLIKEAINLSPPIIEYGEIYSWEEYEKFLIDEIDELYPE